MSTSKSFAETGKPYLVCQIAPTGSRANFHIQVKLDTMKINRDYGYVFDTTPDPEDSNLGGVKQAISNSPQPFTTKSLHPASSRPYIVAQVRPNGPDALRVQMRLPDGMGNRTYGAAFNVEVDPGVVLTIQAIIHNLNA